MDCVVFLAVLEHLNHPKKTMEGIHRILKKGGVLLLTTPSPSSKPILEFLAKIQVINEDVLVEHKKYWSKEELISFLKEFGFKVEFEYFQFGLNQRVIARK